MNKSTVTGRTYNTGPRLQNIPIRTKEGQQIRDLFLRDRVNILDELNSAYPDFWSRNERPRR